MSIKGKRPEQYGQHGHKLPLLHSDDMKKEAAKMMKKINEVAERSENLETQVDAKMIF